MIIVFDVEDSQLAVTTRRASDLRAIHRSYTRTRVRGGLLAAVSRAVPVHSRVRGIVIHWNGGTFSQVRAVAAVANTIGFIRGVPVVAVARLDRSAIIHSLRSGRIERGVAPAYTSSPLFQQEAPWIT